MRQSERLDTKKLALLLPVLTFVLECVLIFTVVEVICPSAGPIQVRLLSLSFCAIISRETHVRMARGMAGNW